ncbi:class I SAM-dependent DNA methyltransferase [Lusitaniella coriacea]|uniref:class I SAM-dependent DNA methyltransferase n=1 Tax=Lusitaniella coriacea TaxID=1983105 RepID=UPI003CED6052
MNDWYREDLAYIQDVGFSNYTLKSAPGILAILERDRIREGLIVELGCRSGLLAEVLSSKEYRVLGIDISESLLEIARTKVPEAEFQARSLFSAEIPPCSAVISVGECFNYLFDAENNAVRLMELFQHIYNALMPGGLFIFDIVEPGQMDSGTEQRFTEGKDWVVLVDKVEAGDILTRRIITFRKVGEFYRRSEEVHRQQLYRAAELAGELERIGFQVEVMGNYGEFALPKARVALIAKKPSDSQS